MSDRPAEVGDLGQPRGERLGNPGPDQGYALRLVRQFEGRLNLGEGEHEHDVIAGCVGVALKRASLFGRAPVIHDLTLAFTIWGFLDDDPDPALVDVRKELFASAGHHYAERRAVVDMVPEATLRLTPTQAADAYAADWREPLGLNASTATA